MPSTSKKAPSSGSQAELVPSAQTNARRSGRLRAGTIITSMGPAVDISAGGIRVSCSGARPQEGDTLVLRITGLDGTLEVGVRVVWAKAIARQSFDLGLEFIDPTPAQRVQLRALALGA